jgi:hypothetical protein
MEQVEVPTAGYVSFEMVGAFLPMVFVPPSTYPSFLIAFTVFLTSLFFSTSTGIQYTLLRLALAPIAIYYFWDFGYGPYQSPTRGVDAGLATVSMYGIMRVLESTFIGLLDEKLPYWVRDEGDGEEIPIPSTVSGRLAYAFDLATSLRGTSWFGGISWNWAPKALTSRGNSPTRGMSRTRFLINGFASLLRQYIILDVIDTINKSRKWDHAQHRPITSLPLVREQIVFATSVCVGILLSITLPYTIISCSCVLFGSHPESWPPMFDAPFSATSLADFWARRWHAIFRRVFARLSGAAVMVVDAARTPRARSHAGRTIRAIVIFGLSAGLHIMVIHRVDITRRRGGIGEFFDSSILKFFLAQPLGLMAEAVVIIPLCDVLLPVWWRNAVVRAWGCMFMVYSGRFWADVWVDRGFWDEKEKVVGFSVIRGVMNGQWVI